ncbi:hypothetical protein KIPB_000659 [Kipferlia bialata]|uniref:Uncharacterized protein n=1 Tax=Kipferlia bialata TaxID=797122 RepID=A0A9K3GF70_9EUKA|nr:hypothetical protein KIPB_000659 [Kipferlia bialata]|eukprot:g659.t1
MGSSAQAAMSRIQERWSQGGPVFRQDKTAETHAPSSLLFQGLGEGQQGLRLSEVERGRERGRESPGLGLMSLSPPLHNRPLPDIRGKTSPLLQDLPSPLLHTRTSPSASLADLSSMSTIRGRRGAGMKGRSFSVLAGIPDMRGGGMSADLRPGATRRERGRDRGAKLKLRVPKVFSKDGERERERGGMGQREGRPVDWGSQSISTLTGPGQDQSGMEGDDTNGKGKGTIRDTLNATLEMLADVHTSSTPTVPLASLPPISPTPPLHSTQSMTHSSSASLSPPPAPKAHPSQRQIRQKSVSHSISDVYGPVDEGCSLTEFMERNAAFLHTSAASVGGGVEGVGYCTLDGGLTEHWVACRVVGRGPEGTVSVVVGERTHQIHPSCIVNTVHSGPDTISLEEVLELDSLTCLAVVTPGSALEQERVRLSTQRLAGQEMPRGVAILGVSEQEIWGMGDQRTCGLTDRGIATGGLVSVEEQCRADAYQERYRLVVQRVLAMSHGVADPSSLSEQEREEMLGSDVLQQIKGACLAASPAERRRPTNSCRDALEYRIGIEEVTARAEWLQDNLMYLDVDIGPRIREFQATLSDVCSLFLTITPQSAIMNPDALSDVFKTARSELSQGFHVLTTPLPHIECAMEERPLLDSLETNAYFAAQIRDILDEVVRGGIQECFSLALSQDIERKVDAEVSSRKRNQMQNLLSGGKRRVLGKIQDMSIDTDMVRREVMAGLKDKAKSLLRMLDTMAAAALGTTGILYSEPWRQMLKAMSPSHYITPPCLNVDNRATGDGDTNAAKLGQDDVMGEMGSDPSKAAQDIWPYLQGNHAVGITTADGTSVRVSCGPYPKYPVYMQNISARLTDPDGDGHTRWVVDGGLSDREHLALRRDGLRGLMQSFSQWRGTLHPYLHRATDTPIVTNCLPDYISLLGSAYRSVFPHSLRVHTTLRNTMEARLNVPKRLSPETIRAITGLGSYTEIVSAFQQRPDSTVLEMPPGDIKSYLDTSLFLLEKEMLSEFQEFIFSLPNSAFYGGACTHPSTVKPVLQRVLDQAIAESKVQHVTILSSAVQCVLWKARQLDKALSMGIYSPEASVHASSLVNSVTETVPQWQECVGILEAYCDMLLTDGCFVSCDTHCDMSRITGFVRGLNASVKALEKNRLICHRNLCAQLSGIGTWMSTLASTIQHRCKCLTHLSYECLGLLCQSDRDGVMCIRDQDDPRVFEFLFNDFAFPSEDHCDSLIQRVEGLLDHVPPGDSQNVIMTDAGLLLAFQAYTGLPIVRPLPCDPNSTNLDKTSRAIATAVASVPCAGTDSPQADRLPRNCEYQYKRPSEKCDLSIESVLFELTHLLEAGRRGAALVAKWAVDLNRPEVTVSPGLDWVPGNPYLLHRANVLLNKASAMEVLLSNVPVADQVAASLLDTIADMGGCIAAMREQSRKKAAITLASLNKSRGDAVLKAPPNRSFAQAVKRKQLELNPTVQLVSLLKCPNLQRRHLDSFESETGLPLLRLSEMTPSDLVSAGALDMMVDIQTMVDGANEEAQVEARLDACEHAMGSWSSEVSIERDIDSGSQHGATDAGFPLPPHFFETLRSVALYVQRDVGSTFAASITARARSVENTMLWALHAGSLIRHVQHYMAVSEVLSLGVAPPAYSGPYLAAASKWYSLRKGVQRASRNMLLDVIVDTNFSESLHSIIAGLAPVVQLMMRRPIAVSCHEASVLISGDTSLRGLRTVPNKATYMQAPAVRPLPLSVTSRCEEGEMWVAYAPRAMYNHDGYVVARAGAGTPREGDQVNVGESGESWVITAITSQTRHPNLSEVLRLKTAVPLPPVRCFIPRDTRQAIRDAVRDQCDVAIRDLNEGQMHNFWNLRNYHCQYVALSEWIHDTLRKATVSPNPTAELNHSKNRILAQVALPEQEGGHRIGNTYLSTRVVPEWLDNVMSKITEGCLTHVSVLNVPCVARSLYKEKAPLCVSSLGVHHRQVVHDWLGVTVPPTVVQKSGGEDVVSSQLNDDDSGAQLTALLATGITIGVCNSRGSVMKSTMRYFISVAMLLGMSPFFLAISEFEDPCEMGCTLSNLLLDGHLVYLVGLEDAPLRHVQIFEDIATTLQAGGEFPYASGPKTPQSETSDTDLCVVRSPLGKAAHPSEHTVGALMVWLPVLETGPFAVPQGLPRNSAIRYVDVRPAAERLRFIPKSAGKPCLALRSSFAHSNPRLFLDPQDLGVAMAIRNRGRHSPNCTEVDEMETGDTPEAAVYKYLSMSFLPDDREGLLSAVSAAFGSSVDGERETEDPQYMEPVGVLSGEGAYAASWLRTLLEAPCRTVWIQSPCISSALAIVQHAAEKSQSTFSYRRSIDEAESNVEKTRDWHVVDMSFDPTGLQLGHVGEGEAADLTMLIRGGRTPRRIFISPALPAHSFFRVHVLRVNLDMVCVPAAMRHSVLSHTGVRPDITNSSDPVSYFFGAVSRFWEMLDVNLSSLEGSFAQAVMWWLLSEQGAVTLRPHPVNIDISGASDGRILVDQIHRDPSLFSLPNVGPVLDIVPSVPYFSSFGSSSTLGHSVSLFMSAFAVVYTTYTFLTAFEADYGGEYQLMVDVTTQEHALDKLRVTHPEFSALTAPTLIDCCPSLDPEAFVPLRYNPAISQLETYTLRDPVELEDFYMTHPRWTMPPVLTSTNRAFAHSMAACMLFGVPGIINSTRTVGKSWAVAAASNLLPSFFRTIGHVALSGVADGLSNHITRAADGSLVPLFSHGLAVLLEEDSATAKELLAPSTFRQLVSRRVQVTDTASTADIYSIRERPVPILPVEQDDGLSSAVTTVRLEGLSMMAETHIDLSRVETDPSCQLLPSYAIVFNGDQLIDYNLVEGLFSQFPIHPDHPAEFRPVLLKSLMAVCDTMDLSPLRLLESIKRMGLVATKQDPSMYYVTPTTIFVATLRIVDRSLPLKTLVALNRILKDQIAEGGFGHVTNERSAILQASVSPTDKRAWSDILTALHSGTGAPPPRTFYFVNDCFAPLLHSMYPLQDILSELHVEHPDIVPTVLKMAVQQECWMAVNNSVARTLDDVGMSSGLKALRVPTLTMSLLDKDVMDVYRTAQLLFKMLAFNTSLSHVVTPGFTRLARENTTLAKKREAFINVEENRHMPDGSPSLRGAVSLDESTVSGVSDSSASFFGSQHERYLPRMVVDIDLVFRGIPVAESHESNLQHIIWTSMGLPGQEARIAAFIRLAIVLSCGLPAGLALPLSDTQNGIEVDCNVSPYKIFPGGDVNSQIHGKYPSERTLFSRVLLHIPGDQIPHSPLLRQCLVAFNKGLVPPVFSRAALGQMYLSLAEKYSLPQPDACTLVMKMAQHLAVVVTSGKPPEERLSFNLNMGFPTRTANLLKATPSMYRYLDRRFNNNRDGMDVIRMFMEKLAGMFGALCNLDARNRVEFNKYVAFGLSAKNRYMERARAERAEISSFLAELERHESFIDETDSTTMRYLHDLKQGVALLTPRSETDPSEHRLLINRGANFATLFMYTEQFWLNAATEPEFQDLRGVVENLCGIEDMGSVQLSTSLFVTAMANRFYFMYPPAKSPKPFLWLYAGALPAVDTALLSCVRACYATVHYPTCIPFLDKESGPQVASCLLMWREGLLDMLKASNTEADNAKVMAMARKRCNIVVLPMDLPGHLFFPMACKAINAGAHIILSGREVVSAGAQEFLTLIVRFFYARNTRPGQILLFQDGAHKCRLRQPVHKMWLHVCMDPAAYSPSCTLMDCRAVQPTLTLEILNVLQQVARASDTGPFQQAALAEEAPDILRGRFWGDLRTIMGQLVTTAPSLTSSSAIIRSTSHMLGLSKDVNQSHHSLAALWAKPGIDYGLTRGVNMISAHMARFPSPMMRNTGRLSNQLALLTSVIAEHVSLKGFASLNTTTMRRLYIQSCNALIASTAEPNALYDLPQQQLLVLIINTAQLVFTEELDTATVSAIVYALGGQFSRMASLADPAEVDRIYEIALSSRASPLCMYPVLSKAFRRLAVLEALAPMYSGLMESVVSTDAAFADAILLATDLDGGLSLLSSLLGNHSRREAILGGRKVKKQLRLPDCLGTSFSDRTLQLHLGAMCCLCHSSALIAAGAWCRALSTDEGTRAAQRRKARVDKQMVNTAVALKIPLAQVEIQALVTGLVESTQTIAVALINQELTASTEQHLVQSLQQCGMQPCYGLHHNMSPKRVAIVQWNSLRLLDVSDPILHQPMKMIVVVTRRVRTDLSGNKRLLDLLIRRAVVSTCVRCEQSPIRAAYDMIPPVTLQALSSTPHFLSTPTVSVPVFVSPAFSTKMRRVLSGMVLSCGQRQFHVTANHASPLEAQIGVGLCIRQIGTLSRFLVAYGQDASHLYDVPLLSRDTKAAGFVSVRNPALAQIPSTPGRTASARSVSSTISSCASRDLGGLSVNTPRAMGTRISTQEGIPLVGQESAERGLLEICCTRTPTNFYGAFTWQDRFTSGVPRPLAQFITRRYLRQMTDTVCFSGYVCHLLPVQLEFPGLCRHCANGQGSEWMGVDALRGQDNACLSQRTGITGMTNKTGMTAKTSASRRSARSRVSVPTSARSVVSNTPSDGGTVQKRGVVKHASQKPAIGLSNALEHVTEYGEFRIALYYPSAQALQMTAVTDPSQIEALVDKQHKVYAGDGQRCSTADVLNIIGVQDIHYRPGEIERLHTDLRNLRPPSAEKIATRSESHAARETSGNAGPRPDTDDTEGVRGEESGSSEARLDYLSEQLLDTINSLEDDTFRHSPSTQSVVYRFLLSYPVSHWHEVPCDVSGIKTLSGKRSLLSSLMILFANHEGIRQCDCRYEVSVVPPAPGSDRRQSPVVRLRAVMCGFRLSADRTHPVVSSFLIPSEVTEVYVRVVSECQGALDSRAHSDVSSESSMSLVSLGQRSDMHLSHIPSLELGGAGRASIPVVLGNRQLGRVSLSDRVGQGYWISAGAYFDIV